MVDGRRAKMNIEHRTSNIEHRKKFLRGVAVLLLAMLMG